MRKTFFAKKLQVENNVKGKYIEKIEEKTLIQIVYKLLQAKILQKRKPFFCLNFKYWRGLEVDNNLQWKFFTKDTTPVLSLNLQISL